jgi:hypothetical protein
VIGYVGFALPEGGDRVEGDVEGDVLRYDDHGISFTYPAELSAIELGLLTEEADEFSGSVTAGGESGNRAIFVQWLGAPTGIVYTNRDLITYVDEVLAAITADTDRLTAGDLVTTEANGVFVAHRSWSGVLEGDSANGVTAATMCRESNTVLLLQAIGAGGRSAAETMADLESVLESVDC